MKKILVLIMVVLMMVIMVVPVSAAENDFVDGYVYTYFNSGGVDLKVRLPVVTYGDMNNAAVWPIFRVQGSSFYVSLIFTPQFGSPGMYSPPDWSDYPQVTVYGPAWKSNELLVTGNNQTLDFEWTFYEGAGIPFTYTFSSSYWVGVVGDYYIGDYTSPVYTVPLTYDTPIVDDEPSSVLDGVGQAVHGVIGWVGQVVPTITEYPGFIMMIVVPLCVGIVTWVTTIYKRRRG